VKLDTRFLTTHPRTVLWWEQREQCRGCAHAIIEEVERRAGFNETSTTMRCAALEPYPHTRTQPYCIDARDPGKPCGPKAVLFTPAKKGP
jgi:hypothetical protein